MFADLQRRIDTALAAGDVAAAVELARQALAAGDPDPFVGNLVAWQQVEGGDPPGGEALARAGLVNSPDDPGLRTTLGLALRRQGRLGEALAAFDTAIAAAPDYPVAWLERGFALHQGNSLVLAEASYRRAAQLDPGRAAAFAGIAAIASAQGEAATAHDFAGRALAIDRLDAVAHCAIARCDIAAGQGGDAADRLRQLLLLADLSLDNLSAAQSLLGDAMALLGDPAAAVAAWQAAKATLGTRFPRLTHAEPLHRLVGRITAAIADGPARWAPPPRAVADPAGGRRHAFLLGYPRSGTTLVETILASAVGVEALEELPTLLAAESAFYLPADGLERLEALDSAGADLLRAAYWQRVADFGVSANAGLFVDMDPLKSMDLPLIGRLFPDAALVVMRRDPRDVVLSCFRQNFAASPVAFEYTSLAATARHYDALMQLQQASLRRLGNPVLELRYEALVADFDTTTQALCGFLGLDWSERLRDFSTTARARNVGTASVGQVRRGLYNGGGQWRRFAAQLEPVLPLLAPWIERFGYAPP